MKAVLQLTVELDYNEIANEDNLEILQAFTNKDATIDDIRSHHLQTVARKVEESVKGMHGVVYHIDGQFIPPALEEAEPVEWETAEEDKAVGAPPSASEEDFEKAVEAAMSDPSDDEAAELVSKLKTDLYDIVDEAQPVRIVLNGKMARAIEIIHDRIDYFEGFPLEVEGMEEPYYIVFKAYGGKEESFFYPEFN